MGGAEPHAGVWGQGMAKCMGLCVSLPVFGSLCVSRSCSLSFCCPEAPHLTPEAAPPSSRMADAHLSILPVICPRSQARPAFPTPHQPYGLPAGLLGVATVLSRPGCPAALRPTRGEERRGGQFSLPLDDCLAKNRDVTLAQMVMGVL